MAHVGDFHLTERSPDSSWEALLCEAVAAGACCGQDSERGARAQDRGSRNALKALFACGLGSYHCTGGQFN